MILILKLVKKKFGVNNCVSKISKQKTHAFVFYLILKLKRINKFPLAATNEAIEKGPYFSTLT